MLNRNICEHKRKTSSQFSHHITEPIDNDSATSSYDFKNPINQAEDEDEDDYEVPGELARLL